MASVRLVVSEATRRVPDGDKARRPEIPWRAVAGIGNVLRHEYHATAPKIVWEVVVRDLPLLREAVTAIEMGTRVEDLHLAIHAHPTLSEAIAEATLDAMGRMIHA